MKDLPAARVCVRCCPRPLPSQAWVWTRTLPHHRRPFLRCDSWRSHRSRFSGAVNGGTIAYVQDGDIISIDIPNHSIQLEVSDEELAERKKTTKILVKENLTGYLKRYSKMVSSADKGAIINRMD